MSTRARAAVLAAIVLAALASAAAADETYITGAHLKAACEGAAPDYCRGYLRGVVDVHLGNSQKERYFCLPVDQGTDDELRAVFLGYIAANPAKINEPASIVVWRALRATYPCKP